MYPEEDYLQLSGIQHFAFCRRQWALIHIEQAWAENFLTTEGNLLHDRAHDQSLQEKRGSVLIVRGLRVSSATLGFSGTCDVVEFVEAADGVSLCGHKGTYVPYPVEYKRGKPKADDCDRLQLCAEAVCLEEMLVCDIPKGALYYGAERHREVVDFTAELRKKVSQLANEMHQYYRRQYIPKARPGSYCWACSLRDICIPELNGVTSVHTYLEQHSQDT